MNAVQRKGSHTAAATAGAHAAKLHRVAGWVRDGLLIAVLSISFLFLICFGGVTKSFAATGGIALSDVNLRAGPSTRYPVVSVLPRSASLSVYGCIADQSWCDIGWGGYRGWVAASYVQVIYKDQPTVLTAAVVPAVGIATVAFTVAYWDAHYHAQPWYGQWNRYYGGYSRSVAVGCNDNGCGAAASTHGPRGGGRHVAGGCQDGNCGGAAVTHGPRGGGRAAIGGCNDGRCAGASVTRGPRGNTVIRHGGFDRP